MSDLTWSCHICKQVKSDKQISVLTYPWKDKDGQLIEGGEVNLRYCNDSPTCMVAAREQAKKGTLFPA